MQYRSLNSESMSFFVPAKILASFLLQEVHKPALNNSEDPFKHFLSNNTRIIFFNSKSRQEIAINFKLIRKNKLYRQKRVFSMIRKISEYST